MEPRTVPRMVSHIKPSTGVPLGMRTLRRSVILAAMVLLTFAASADSAVGEISSLSGEVTIDAFGTGDYIRAIAGEVLYRQSVVRTGFGGKAVLTIGGRSAVVASESELAIGSLVQSRERRNRFGWLRSLTGTVKSAFDAVTGRQEDVALGPRAGNAGDSDQIGWVVEDENEDAFNEAIRLIGDDDFAGAIALLKEIYDPLPGTFLPGEVSFWIGHCQFQLENYVAALEAHKTALEEIREQRTNPRGIKYYDQIVFQSGASLYMTGDSVGAAETMASLAERVSDDQAALTFFILIESLLATGAEDQARRYYADAPPVIAESGLGAEFAALGRRFR